MHWENVDFKQNQARSMDFGLGISIYNLEREILYRYNRDLNSLKPPCIPLLLLDYAVPPCAGVKDKWRAM